MNFNEMFEKRAGFVRAIEALDDKVEDLKKERNTIDEAIIARLDAEGLSNIKSKELGTLTASEQRFASLDSDQKDLALELAKKYIPDLVKESVNTRTLAGWLKEARKNNQEVAPEFLAVIKESVKRILTWRRR